MSTGTAVVRHSDAELRPDPGRVVAQLFLPGEDLPSGRSRAAAVVSRVLALPETEIEQLAARLLEDFTHRHRDYAGMLERHAALVNSHHLPDAEPMSAARTLVMGASVTAEYAVEGAALCNPSAVPHPDQSGLGPGQLRVAVSLRGIGERHLSSIGFADAVAGPGPVWSFEPRTLPAVAGVSSPGPWSREHLRVVLDDHFHIDELAHSVLAVLPEEFVEPELQLALSVAHQDLLARPGGATTGDVLRQVVGSAYAVAFPPDVTLSQQVLMPSAAEESNGMEDARFVWFAAGDGAGEYRGTYTAYDGYNIAPRLITSPDLRAFRVHRLAGPAARNKGMALFPRLVGGRHLSLCRSDGESTWLTGSADGLVWDEPVLIQEPQAPWEVLQVGNCGPPIETEHGWLVLTHGVGPMRSYAIGAILLDLDEPTRVIGRLAHPLLRTTRGEQDGYVPNVVYSCGGIVHDGLLWLPYGIGDSRIGVACTPLEDLLADLVSARG
jgi:predicted GH43/DUF377 family glycosyl hydrolase